MEQGGKLLSSFTDNDIHFALVGVAFGLLVYRATRPVSEHMLLDTTERPMPSAVPHLASIHDSIMDSDRMQAAL